jgi:alpha-tubulin suppressor-like RCC1 family protein
VRCWGYNVSGQLGYNNTIDQGGIVGSMVALLDINLGVGRTAKAITVGQQHTCVILDDNNVKCWGANDSGQLGYSDTINRGNTAGSMAALVTVNLGTGRTAKAISAALYHTCAILDDNSVKCWGANHKGQLGYDDMVNRGNTAGSMAALASVNLGTGRTAKAISAGGNTTCAILDNNSLKCWGDNSLGQLGSGLPDNAGSTPGSMAQLAPINFGTYTNNVNSISAGYDHVCAGAGGNHVWCWGNGRYGALGRGSQVNEIIPASNPLDSVNYENFTTYCVICYGTGVVAGQNMTCIIGRVHSDSSVNLRVRCWGRNQYGQLGIGDTLNRGDAQFQSMSYWYELFDVTLGAYQSPPMYGVKFISNGGGSSTCAILGNDQLQCWGANHKGQLGYDDKLNRGENAWDMERLSNVKFK